METTSLRLKFPADRAGSNASIDIDGIMAVGIIWMSFSYSFLRSWAMDPKLSLGKTFSIMVRSSVKPWTSPVTSLCGRHRPSAGSLRAGAAPVASSRTTDPCGLARAGVAPVASPQASSPLRAPPYSWWPLRSNNIQVYDVDVEDGSRLMDLRLSGRRWMEATSKAIMGIA
ncbi:hypothetical protein GW17_00048555 [Ensete ventricosum]|nr:hypothetical protein GW17_00048555 [Ensete ventricosum]